MGTPCSRCGDVCYKHPHAVRKFGGTCRVCEPPPEVPRCTVCGSTVECSHWTPPEVPAPDDSAELAAIRARVADNAPPVGSLGMRDDALALLRMVGELQSRPLFWSFKQACADRDELREKLAEVEKRSRDADQVTATYEASGLRFYKRAEAAETLVKELTAENEQLKRELEKMRKSRDEAALILDVATP